MCIGIGLIVVVAALNIVASLILLVMEKTRDIAILKTMGASSRSIRLIFLLQGRHRRRRHGDRRHAGVLRRVLSSIATADQHPDDIYQVSLPAVQVVPRRFRGRRDRRRW